MKIDKVLQYSEDQVEKARKFNDTIKKLAAENFNDGQSGQSSIMNALQSIDKTLKRIEIILWKDIGNRSAFFDVPDLYRRMSVIGLVDSHAESE